MKKLILVAVFALTAHANAGVKTQLITKANGELGRNTQEINTLLRELINDCTSKPQWNVSLGCSLGLVLGLQRTEKSAFEDYVKANEEKIAVYNNSQKTRAIKDYIQTRRVKIADAKVQIANIETSIKKMETMIETMKNTGDESALLNQSADYQLKVSHLLPSSDSASRTNIAKNRRRLTQIIYSTVDTTIATKRLRNL